MPLNYTGYMHPLLNPNRKKDRSGLIASVQHPLNVDEIKSFH
jgi:hypothetical protein